jgi:hypothetical protein
MLPAKFDWYAGHLVVRNKASIGIAAEFVRQLLKSSSL